MTEEKMWEEIEKVWQEAIDILKVGIEVAAENADYKKLVHFTMAVQQCYLAMNGDKPDFDGINLT